MTRAELAVVRRAHDRLEAASRLMMEHVLPKALHPLLGHVGHAAGALSFLLDQDTPTREARETALEPPNGDEG